MSHHQHVKYLLVGGGVASSAAARAIREHDLEGSIQLIGQEPTRPYPRSTLSKGFLRGNTARDSMFTQYVGWFKENHVDLHTGVRAVRLDAGRKLVAMDNGDELTFDRLLLATGGSPKHLVIPGSHLANVHYLRNLADADRLRNAIEKARNEGRPFERADRKGRGTAVVIGGGLLGVELAASLTQSGLAVDLIVAAAHPWNKFAGESTGKFVTRHLERHGVAVHLDAEAKSLDGDGRVQRVTLTDGRSLPCDFVVAAVGLVPSKELLRNTSIAGERAILTDAHCRTNAADIFAAGDCAALYDPLFGKHRQLDHWDSAALTGELAGLNMAGVDRAYDAVSHFSSEVFDLTLDVWGEAKRVDHSIVRGVTAADQGEYVEIGVAADGRVAQVITLDAMDRESPRSLVKARFAVSGREDMLRDPATPLRALLGA